MSSTCQGTEDEAAAMLFHCNRLFPRKRCGLAITGDEERAGPHKLTVANRKVLWEFGNPSEEQGSEQRERGTFPGAASFTARGPKGSGAKHKGSGHCHSPQSPAILKATFQSRRPPSPPHPAPPPVDRDGSERATVGYLQREEPRLYLRSSQDEGHRRRTGRISSARPGRLQTLLGCLVLQLKPKRSNVR
ncbi:hypothetical protein EYF80_004217 [Liparis tanakae]|uniref:Uncharacterized protein n=1 Tax=Liparis tanakae TaxID=230148 RepID=A0A4Z2J6R4_9TELE|nr:hypothetical protein EYF80_004217 [Liparis tanakae]